MIVPRKKKKRDYLHTTSDFKNPRIGVANPKLVMKTSIDSTYESEQRKKKGELKKKKSRIKTYHWKWSSLS